MAITNLFKETLSNSLKFTTFSLVLTMLEKCIHMLLDYGVSCETVSFFNIGYEKLQKELEEGYQYIKTNEDFKNIVKSLENTNDKNKIN